MRDLTDPLQVEKIKMLDHFYGLFILFCAALAVIGVPFVFHRKLLAAILLVVVMGGAWLARKRSRHGNPQQSLIHFSIGLWVVLTALLYAGLPTNGAGIALATSVMLAVVVHQRAAFIFLTGYLLAWLAYIVLAQLQMAPTPVLFGSPFASWMMVTGAFLMLLIPIPKMVRALNDGAAIKGSLLEATSDAILVVNSSGELESYNQRMLSLWSVPPAEFIVKKDRAVILKYVMAQLEDPDAFMRRVSELYAKPEESSFEMVKLMDGRVIERHSHPNRLNGKVVGRVWSFRDVTEDFRAREELVSSKAKLQGLFDLSPLGMIRNGMDGTFYEVNPAILRILGYSLEELKALGYAKITPPEYAEQEAFQIEELRTKGRFGPYEKEYFHKNGHKVPVRLNGILIQSAPGESYAWSIIEDITEQKSHELKLTEARKLAEDASLAKGQFLANMSHEIRTPMNAILGMLSLLQDTELTSRQRDYASKTEGAAQSLLGLLNDILDFSKVESGKMSLESEPFPIERLLRSLSVVLSANVGDKEVEVLFDIDPTLPEVVRGDAMRLQQVLVNLGGNAVKFTNCGQVVLALRKVQSVPDAVTIAFSVQDTGIGIAPEHQTHIFDGFTQAEGSTTRRFGGTGLGLAICKRFVELMGGEIQLESVLGKGSTFSFTLTLPIVVEAPADLAAPQKAVVPPQRVLVVDDNPFAGNFTMGMMRALDWPADLVASGKAALDLIQSKMGAERAAFPYTVVYVDWQMPSMDGWETTRRIREIAAQSMGPQPMVIMIAAHGHEMLAQRSEAEQSQLNGFLMKPVTASMLKEALQDARSGSHAMRLATKAPTNRKQLQGMRILVVEDNLINQQVAKGVLSSEGALVTLAANGRLGADAVAAATPQFDVVLMDLQMPEVDGYEATRIIRNELGLKDLLIIAMTANVMASDREACFAAGMNEHVGKPFNKAKLVALLLEMTGFKPEESVGTAEPEAIAAVPHVPGLDLAAALGRMAGMHALYARTAKEFSKSLSTFVQELRQGYAAGDTTSTLMRLHTLKGNAGTLGATELASKAASLEQLCKAKESNAECDAAFVELDALIATTQRGLYKAIAILSPGLPAQNVNPTQGVGEQKTHIL